MTLKVYGDRMSQPTRTVIIFCKVNGIDFEEVRVELSKRQHLTPEFQGINPMKKVPAIVDGRFKLFESHAILTYLACVFPGVADHWYPADLFQRAKIHSVLDWHHSNLRPGAGAAETSTSELLLDCLNTFPMNFSLHTLLIRIGGFRLSCLGAGYVLNSTLAPALGLPLNPKAAAENEKLLSASLRKIESVWLKGSGRFLLGSSQPSIADLSLVCEIMQLELVDEKDRERILGPHQRVVKWIDDTKNATRPHFDEVHSVLYKVKGKLKKLQSEREVGETPSTSNTVMRSKM